MKTVVVTGSTRGIGLGLVENFLKRGCKVVVTGRGQERVDQTVKSLGETYGADNVVGKAGDISNYDDIQALWDFAKSSFGTVDVWINNAGMSVERQEFWKVPKEAIEAVVTTNVTGLMYANQIVIAGMLEQGSGQIWNMEGYGSNGMTQAGLTSYGTTKRAVNYLLAALKKEVKDTPVQVNTLSPGIVVTDLLVGDYDLQSEEWQKVKKTFNILGDTVETVTPYLVDGVLASNKNGDTVAWLTGPKAFKKFLTAPFNKRELFAEVEAKAKAAAAG